MTYYLIDTENVARRWAPLAERAEAGDVFVLFYSRNVGPVSMGLFGPACRRGARFDFIECRTGPNAMDFQIATELGRLVGLHPDDKFVVVSGDAGFGPAIRYWEDRGIDISRECPGNAAQPASGNAAKPVPAQSGEQEAELAAAKEYRAALTAAGLSGTDLRVAIGILMAAMRMPEKNRRRNAYNRFLARYGKADGLRRYSGLKDLIAGIAVTGPFPPPAGDEDGQAGDGLPDQNELDEAVAAAGIELTESQRGKLHNMFRHARTHGGKKKLYETQLKESLGTDTGGAVFAATAGLLG